MKRKCTLIFYVLYLFSHLDLYVVPCILILFNIYKPTSTLNVYHVDTQKLFQVYVWGAKPITDQTECWRSQKTEFKLNL